MKQGQTRPERLTALERRTYVLHLRQTGRTYRHIAEIMRSHPTWHQRLPPKYDARAVHRDVRVSMRHLQDQLSEEAAAVRTLELARLDRLMVAMWPRAVGTPADLERGIPAVPAEVGAQQMVLNIMQRRARYLPGLEGPHAIAPTPPTDQTPPLPPEILTVAFLTEVVQILAQYGLLDHEAAQVT